MGGWCGLSIYCLVCCDSRAIIRSGRESSRPLLFLADAAQSTHRNLRPVGPQDRTHDLSVVATYGLSQRWSLSALFVYNTGNAVTFPGGKYNIGGQTVYYYTERNG